MKWLEDAIKNYNNLSETEQVHVDAALDQTPETNVCVCGEKNCADAYAHVTSGY